MAPDRSPVFAKLIKGAAIGQNCSIGQKVCIGSSAVIGEGVKIQNNISVYDGVTLEDGVFCGPFYPELSDEQTRYVVDCVSRFRA